GAFVNSGTIGSQQQSGIFVDVASFVGGIKNTGTITSTNSEGINLTADRLFNPLSTFGIINSGSISAKPTAINLNGSTFAGGITNSGSLTSSARTGIVVHSTSFTGGITNSGSGSINSNYTGIYVDASTFTGGIRNAGSIVSTTGVGIDAYGSYFSGGITN